MSKRITTFGKLKSNTADIAQIDTYFQRFKTPYAVISDEVYKDLNIEEFFNYANRCLTPIGEMLLYHKMRHLSVSDNIDAAQSVITDLSECVSLREKVESILTKLSRKINYRVADLLQLSTKINRWHRYIKYLPIIYCLIIIALLVAKETVILILFAVFILSLNIVIHYFNKMYVEINIRPLIQLTKLKVAAMELVKVDKYSDTASISDSINTISRLENKLFIFALNKYAESDLALLFNMIIELIKVVFLIEPIMIEATAKETTRYKQEAKRLIDYIGTWDVYYSNASLRAWLNEHKLLYCSPNFSYTESPVFDAHDLYHPLVINCIPNDIALTHTAIITGSNMSGKSTFLRTIGINIVSAYALNISFASRLHLSKFNLYSILSVEDSMTDAKSYFISEVERIKYAIDRCTHSSAGEYNIVLIDEIFKGTNTIERISIANAVIKHFINLKNTIAIVSTHDIELVHSFKSLLTIYHFDEVEDDNKTHFDYKLKPGMEYNRNALSILKRWQYPQTIIACAATNIENIKDRLNIELQ